MQAIGCRGWRPGQSPPRPLGASGQRDEHSRLIGKASHGAVGDVQHHFKRKQHRRPGKERGQAGDHPPPGQKRINTARVSSPTVLHRYGQRTTHRVTGRDQHKGFP
jgi:hypothetical protein